MKIIFTALLLCFMIPLSYAQGPGQPFFPETADGASNIYFQFHSLRWQNPLNVNYNEVYIGFDSARVADMDTSALYISGSPSTVFDSIRIDQELYYPTRYFWCVVEYNSEGFTRGDVWSYTTIIDLMDYTKLDDLSYGLGKWNIGSLTGCGWQLGDKTDYTLPDPSTGKVLTADASICGGLIQTTATFETAADMEYMYASTLEFNSDWNTNNAVDYATVEKSTDDGASWTLIWIKAGVSDRNQHISLPLFNENGITDTIYNVRVRFSTLQNSVNSWWAIDNIAIIGFDGILTHLHPYFTSADANYGNQSNVIIRWHQPFPVPGDIIERKEGLPSGNSPYQTIATVPASYTNSYVDSTINDSSIYTYRIGYQEYNNWYVYGNEATAYVFPPVPVELVSFAGSVIDGSVVLNWITATELNNKGFEVERSQKSKVKSQNEWEPVGFVYGNGTTTEANSYSYTDKNLSAGDYQYRLKQIDFDGSFEYSSVVEVAVNTPSEFSLAQNYPNPFNPVTSIQYAVGSKQFVTLNVYDVLGNEVATLVNEERPAGSYIVNFDGSKLSSGIYFYQITAGSFKATKKLILLK